MSLDVNARDSQVLQNNRLRLICKPQRGITQPRITAGPFRNTEGQKHYRHLAPNYVADTVRAAFDSMGILNVDKVTDSRRAGQPRRAEFSQTGDTVIFSLISH
jgi:hypothetical protein